MLAHQEKLRICGYKVFGVTILWNSILTQISNQLQIPHYFWFMMSGGICDIMQAFIDYGISVIYVLNWEKPTVCWTCSYIVRMKYFLSK